MAYFPFYVELKDVSVLIVGGGKVALHKVKRILDYGPKIKVVAKKVDERIKNIKGVEWEEREFEDSDVEGVRFVIAAAGDEELDEHITSLCNDKGIFINVVDVKDKCDFIFPSVVSRGKLEIGISSSATLSLTEPAGLRYSSLTNISASVAPAFAAYLDALKRGVLPINSKLLSTILLISNPPCFCEAKMRLPLQEQRILASLFLRSKQEKQSFSCYRGIRQGFKQA